MSAALRVSLFYAAAFFAAGVQLPFWPVWLAGRGLDAGEIGLVLAIGQWILPLADTITLVGEGMDYGPVRLWSTFAFILATLLGGRILTGRSPETVLYLLVGATILVALACTLVPLTGRTAATSRGSAWPHLLTPRHLVFLAAATLIQGSHGVYYGFGTHHWRSLGFWSDTIAWLWPEGAIAEMVLFYCGRQLLDRLGPFALLALGVRSESCAGR